MMESLERDLITIINELNFAIEQVKKEFPDNPYSVRYRDGKFILLDAIAAKANAMSALSHLARTL